MKISNTASYFSNERKARGISQAKIARHLGYSSGQYISNFERGDCPLPLYKLFKACRFMRIDPNRLRACLLADFAEDRDSKFR